MPSTSIGDRHGVDAEGQLGVQAWLNLLQVSAEALHDGDGVARNGVEGRPSDQGDENETGDQEDHPAARATAGHHPSESILPLPNQLLELGTASSPVAPRAALVAVIALGWHSDALPWFRRVGCPEASSGPLPFTRAARPAARCTKPRCVSMCPSGRARTRPCPASPSPRRRPAPVGGPEAPEAEHRPRSALGAAMALPDGHTYLRSSAAVLAIGRVF